MKFICETEMQCSLAAVFAYGRPAFFRTGLSEYKDRICREAYNIFKRDKDAGIVRLGRMKRTPKGTSQTTPFLTTPSPVNWEQNAHLKKTYDAR